MNTGQEYEIQLLSMNLAKIILKKNDKLLISFVNTNTDEVIWSEKMTIQEWHNEVILNIERFIKEVQKNNSILLDSNLMQKLIMFVIPYLVQIQLSFLSGNCSFHCHN